MKTAIVGPGALGCLFASLMHEHGAEVLLLDHNQQRAKRISSCGIHIEGGDKELSIERAIAASQNATFPRQWPT